MMQGNPDSLFSNHFNRPRFSISCLLSLIDLLLLVNAVFAWSAVYQEEETSYDGEDLEEVVLGEVFVWVVFVEL